jgi:hypothetical protein
MKGLVRSNNILSVLFSLVFISSIYGAEIMNKNLGDLKISYRSEGAYSPYKYIQIEIYGSGEGKLSCEFYDDPFSQEHHYTYGNYHEQERKATASFQINQSTLQEFIHLYERADFFNLEVTDLNKDGIRVTDVGTTTLTYSHRGMERTLSYGYVESNPLAELVKLYWQLVKEYLPNK